MKTVFFGALALLSTATAAPLRKTRLSAPPSSTALLRDNFLNNNFRTTQSSSALTRTTRYPFHAEANFIELTDEPEAPTATPPADEAASTEGPEDATGDSAEAMGTTGSTGATGSSSTTGTTGTTGSTGSTGAAATLMGPLEDEGKEDFIVTAELNCEGINVEQVNANMDAIVGALAGVLRSVAQDKIEVTASDKVAAPTAGVNEAVADVKRRRRLLMDKVSAGARMSVIVRGVSEDAGKTAATNLLNAQSGASHPNLVEALQGAGLQTLTGVSFVDGKAPKSRSKYELGPEGAGCTGKIELELSAMAEKDTPASDVKILLRSFCTSQFEAKIQQLGVSDKVITTTCNEAVDVVDSVPEDERLDPKHAPAISTGFCAATRKFFIQEVKSQDPQGVGPSLGVAHSFSDIMALTGETEAQAHTGCCITHNSPGCFDKAIEMCVCQGILANGKPSKFGKIDNHCCTEEWDLTCTENVEWFHCAACPASDGQPSTIVAGYNDASVPQVENPVEKEIADATGGSATGGGATGGGAATGGN